MKVAGHLGRLQSLARVAWLLQGLPGDETVLGGCSSGPRDESRAFNCLEAQEKAWIAWYCLGRGAGRPDMQHRWEAKA